MTGGWFVTIGTIAETGVRVGMFLANATENEKGTEPLAIGTENPFAIALTEITTIAIRTRAVKVNHGSTIAEQTTGDRPVAAVARAASDPV
jgi:hypothetical protein